MVPSTLTKVADRRAQKEHTLTIPKALVFYSICIMSGWLVSVALKITGLSTLSGAIVCSGVYTLLLIPIAYMFDPRVFSQAYWKFPQYSWVGIGIAAILQFFFESGAPLPPTAACRAFGAILIAPFVEELARGVVICPLTARLGTPAGLAVTSILWALPHGYFWTALVLQSVFSIIFVCTRKSMPAVIAAHLVVNLIATWHVGLRTFVPSIH